MWPNPHETANLVTFTEQVRNGKLYFLWSVAPSQTSMVELYTNINIGF